MPDWVWAVATPVAAAVIGWLLKRAMVSVIDERVVPEVQGIRSEMVTLNGQNSRALNTMNDRISATNERVARLEGRR